MRIWFNAMNSYGSQQHVEKYRISVTPTQDWKDNDSVKVSFLRNKPGASDPPELGGLELDCDGAIKLAQSLLMAASGRTRRAVNSSVSEKPWSAH